MENEKTDKPTLNAAREHKKQTEDLVTNYIEGLKSSLDRLKASELNNLKDVEQFLEKVKDLARLIKENNDLFIKNSIEGALKILSEPLNLTIDEIFNVPPFGKF